MGNDLDTIVAFIYVMQVILQVMGQKGSQVK